MSDNLNTTKTLHYYMCDLASILIMNKNGTKIRLKNGLGDGFYKYYVFDTMKDMDEHINNRYQVDFTRLTLEGGDWKVMDYDLAEKYEDKGTKLETNFVYVFVKDTTFYFVNTKDWGK